MENWKDLLARDKFGQALITDENKKLILRHHPFLRKAWDIEISGSLLFVYWKRRVKLSGLDPDPYLRAISDHEYATIANWVTKVLEDEVANGKHNGTVL